MPARVIRRGHRQLNVKKDVDVDVDVDVVHDPTAVDDEMSLGSRALRRAHSLARSSTGRQRNEDLPRMMWASRSSSAC